MTLLYFAQAGTVIVFDSTPKRVSSWEKKIPSMSLCINIHSNKDTNLDSGSPKALNCRKWCFHTYFAKAAIICLLLKIWADQIFSLSQHGCCVILVSALYCRTLSSSFPGQGSRNRIIWFLQDLQWSMFLWNMFP